MRTTICLPRELGPSELGLWRAIRASRPDLDSPFLAPEFTLAVGNARPSARVAVIEDGGRVVGFFPFERRRMGLAVPIGAGLCDFQAIVCGDEERLDVRELLARCGLAAWSFDHLIASQHALVGPAAMVCPSPFIDCLAGFDAYLAEEGRHSRVARQKERKIGREVGPVRFAFDVVHDDRALAQILAWKSEQYRRTGRPDRFASKSNMSLIRELAAMRRPDLSGVLVTMHAGDRLIAGEFSLRSHDVLSGWFTAHDCEFSHYSPGSIRTLHVIEAACKAGLRRYDLGKGEEEYKQRLKTGDLYVCEGWVVRPVPLGYLRRAMSVPRETALHLVLGHPRLRRAARATLERLGTARLALTRKAGSRSVQL